MSRTRLFKPEFFRSRSLAKVTRDARLTFIGLWTEADAAGRGVADPRILKGSIWPLEDDLSAADIDDHLTQLADTGHITLYEVGGDAYFAITSWEKHQAASYRTGEAKHPAPPPVQVAQEPVPIVKGKESNTRSSANDARPSLALADRPPPSVAECNRDFDRWWREYPRKIGKKAALKAFRRARREVSAETLLAGLALIKVQAQNTDAQFIPYPASWLNAGRWEDEPAPSKDVRDPAEPNGLARAPRWQGTA